MFGATRSGRLLAAFVVAGLLVTPASAVAHLLSGFHQSKPKPVQAVSPPAVVARVLARTQQAAYVLLRESSQSGKSRMVVDDRDGRAQTWTGSKVSLIQIGAEVYAPAAKGGCYDSAKRGSALLPNVAGMLLPSGVAGLSYVVKGHTIRWSIKASGSYQPHGSVTTDAEGRIQFATVFSGPGVPLTAVVSYLSEAPKIQAPAKLC